MSNANQKNFEEVFKHDAPQQPAWAELDGAGKAKRALRIAVCIISFGMIFPNAL